MTEADPSYYEFETQLEQLGISPLYTPQRVQGLSLYSQDPGNSVISFERGSHVAAYKLIRRGRNNSGDYNFVVDMKHEHNVPVNRRFYKVRQAACNVELRTGGGEIYSSHHTFTVIGDLAGCEDKGNLYAWLDPTDRQHNEDRLSATFE